MTEATLFNSAPFYDQYLLHARALAASWCYQECGWLKREREPVTPYPCYHLWRRSLPLLERVHRFCGGRYQCC